VSTDEQGKSGPQGPGHQDLDIDTLLERTSRTFALTVPLLPEPTRKAVTVAYLLFRIADTFEDATDWSSDAQIAALTDFAALLDEPTHEAACRLASRWTSPPPLKHAGYVELLAETATVMEAFRDLGPTTRTIIQRHVGRTVEGMSSYVHRKRAASRLALRDLDDLRAYCYIVAGIVGEMLTELFIEGHRVLEKMARYLQERARDYGEGLQLTNILKDAAADATEGRTFLPGNASRSSVFGLARGDLERADEYVAALRDSGAPRGILAFNALPLMLAWATLDRVEAKGPGAKLTRPEVFRIVRRMQEALDAGAPVSWRALADVRGT